MIVGAGPAGLTAAVAARRLGMDVTVFEQAEDFRRIGGGIVLHDNGQRVLEALGVLESFRQDLQPCPVVAAELSTGEVLGTVAFGRLTPPLRYSPAIVLRYRLQEQLLAAARASGVEIRFGQRVVVARLDARPMAVLRFADGAERRAGVLLACDGARSAVRDSLKLPARGRRIGQAYLRGVADVGWREPRARELWYPDGRIFGTAPLPGAQTYFYCTAPRGRWPQILRDGLDPWIASWSGGRSARQPEIQAILAAVGDWSRVTYDEPAQVWARRWCHPPVFLVGDAAHAMAPFLGQGANSALVDALVLVRLLAAASNEDPGGDPIDLAVVGRRYEAIRRRFARRLQASSRRQGGLATLRSAPARWLRDHLLPVLGRADWLDRRAALTTAGFNQAEQEWLSPVSSGL